jgi:DNA topoisomerase-1
MKLVVVESPANAKTINKYLGKDYKVLASYGHIRDLPSKNGSVLPDEDFALKYELLPKSQNHIEAICAAAEKATHLILATDPDREGEGIAWHIVEMLREKNKLKAGIKIERIIFTEITKKAIEEAIKDPRSIDYNLVDAQQARRALDYLVGFNLSPVLWRKLPGCKSAGRVQSVALRIVCEREREIKHFKRQEYWDISADFATPSAEQFKSKLTQIDGQKLDKFAINNDKDAHSIVAEMLSTSYSVTAIDKKQQKRNPYPPFITSTLQQDSARKLGFSSKKTMQIAQKLYEGIDIGGSITGLITYMRTDGVTIGVDAVTQIRKLISKTYGENFLPSSPRLYKSKSKNAQEAHEAIRPTDINLTPQSMRDKLTPDMLKLYTLIWRHTVACQMESAVYDMVNAKIDSANKKFTLNSTGSVMVFKGFYEVFTQNIDEEEEEDDKDRLLPPLEVGQKLDCLGIIPNQHFTEPPPRYNEASLIKKLVELGIGRPSTYAPIISVIQDRKYVLLDSKKRFIPETQGIVANSFLVNFFNKYVEYDFTAKLEEDLDEVAEGKINWKKLLAGFWQPFKSNVDEMGTLRITDVLETLDKILFSDIFVKDDKTCPGCSTGQLALRIGKYGAFYSCERYPDCSFVMKLNSNENPEDIAQSLQTNTAEPIAFDTSNMPIYIKKGPYGWYLQVGENPKDEGFKRVSIPGNIKPQELDKEGALRLIALPRKVGHDDDGNDIFAAIGRFGPYLKYKEKLFSLPKDENPFTITLSTALEIIKKKLIALEAKLAKEASQQQEEGDTKKATPKTKKPASKKLVAKKTVKAAATKEKVAASKPKVAKTTKLVKKPVASKKRQNNKI